MFKLFALDYHIETLQKYPNPLQRLDSVIDWEWFRKPLEEAVRTPSKGPGGRPPFDCILMFKILVLQRFYNLSDAQAEYQIRDRFSFMQFLGLEIGDTIPDEKTIWLFRDKLSRGAVAANLFGHFNVMLAMNQLVAREGSIVDATFVKVPKQRNSREDNATIKAGEIPESFEENPNMLAQKDCDARWTKKADERYYGYKNHINMDAKTGYITEFNVTPANVHDSQQLPELVSEQDQVIYADSAYTGQPIATTLEEHGIENQIHEKAVAGKPLDEFQKLRNKHKSRIRCRVEHVFAFMKNSMHQGMQLRSIGIRRIQDEVAMVNLVYNLFRYEWHMRRLM